MIKTKHDLMMIKHSRVITDPFPEHTDYKFFQAMRNKVQKFLNLNPFNLERPKHISIHEAWVIGYNKAYAEIAATLPNSEHLKGLIG